MCNTPAVCGIDRFKSDNFYFFVHWSKAESFKKNATYFNVHLFLCNRALKFISQKRITPFASSPNISFWVIEPELFAGYIQAKVKRFPSNECSYADVRRNTTCTFLKGVPDDKESS